MAADGGQGAYRVPRFELLEDRIVLDGVPEVTIAGPDGATGASAVDIGAQDVNFTLTFDNTGTGTGYVPYVDLILPSTGSDGDDGVTFDSATFLGEDIDTTILTFDAAGEVTHPFAVDAMGDPFVVTGTPGDTLVVFELPYGSFSAGNPAVDIDLVLDFSNLADLDDDFTLEAIGGFARGCDRLDNPTTDAPIRGTADTHVVDQNLFEVTKINEIAEDDAATGPSYPYTYTLQVDVADGQTLTDFTLTDTLPPEIVYLGNVVITGGTGGTVTTEPPTGTLVTAPDDQLVVDFTSVSGTTTVTFDYYINDTSSATSGPVINPSTGDEATVSNTVVGDGTWDPLDPRDATEAVSDSDTDTFQARSIAVQKSNILLNDNQAGGATTGDEYEFTLNVQVSDYFSYGDIVVTDVLGNGWTYVADSAEFTFVEEGSGSATPTSLTAFETSNFNPTDGTTTNVWDLSAAMDSLTGADGILVGDIAGDGSSSSTQSTIQITYRAEILDQYPGNVPGDQEISQGDVLSNNATVSGTVRENGNTGNILGNEDDVTSNEIEIAEGGIREKEVFAVNGSTTFNPNDPVAAGDTITFRVVYDAPLGSFEDLTIVDNLPQDVFTAGEVTVFNDTTTGIPAAGEAQYGPGDEFSVNSAPGTVPTLTIDGPNNGITFDFSDLSVDPRQPVAIEFLFTVTVEDIVFEPFLLLTNQATAFETDSFGNTINSTEIAQFDYAEPVLDINKTASPTTGVDAGDIVDFSIVINNSGSAPDGAFNVTFTDTLPAGFTIPPTGLDLSIEDGSGNPLAVESPGTVESDLFNASITLVDGATTGSIPPGGSAVITYELLVEDSVTANQSLTNTAEVSVYNAVEGTPMDPPTNRAFDLTDDATVTIDSPEIDKQRDSQQFDRTGPDSLNIGTNELVIGEDVSYIVELEFIEGTFTNAVLTDTPTAGLTLTGGEIISWEPTLSSSNNLGIGAGLNEFATVSGGVVTFDFGTLIVPSDNDPNNNTIQVRIDGSVTGGTRGGDLENTAEFSWSGGSVDDTLTDVVAEPNLTLTKEATPTTVVAGQVVDYSVTIENVDVTNDSPAFDLRLTDTLDPNVTLDNGSITVTGAPATVNILGPNSFEVLIDRLDQNSTITVDYQATVIPGVPAGITIPNTADLTYDSTPDEDTSIGDGVGDDSDDRDYSLSADEELTAVLPDLDKTVISSTFDDTTGANLGIGEEVTFEIVVTIPNGNTSNVTLTDVLPTTPGVLQYVSSEITRIGSDITGATLPAVGTMGSNSGATTTFSFGDLFNPLEAVQDAEDEIEVQITALVVDIPANAAGDVLTNTASLDFINGNGDAASVDGTADVTLVEPVLDITKTPSPATADAGDTVTYTVTSTNTGDGPAYDIIIDDDLADTGLVANGTPTIRILDSGNTDVTPGGADAPSVVFASGELQAIIPELLPDQTIEIVYDAIVQNTALFSSDIPNTATVTRFDSDPAGDETDANGRVYDSGLTGYTVPEADADVATPDATLTKTLIGSTDANTAGSDAVVGETVTYELVVTVPQGTADLTLTDVMPAGLSAQSATFVQISNSPGVTSDITVGATQTGVGSSGNITIATSGDSVTFDFGTTTVAGEDDAAATDTEFVLQITALVEDIAAVTDGATLTNTATLEVTDPGSGTDLQPDVDATADVDIVEPEVTITKASPIAANPGDIVPYTITLENTGTGPAYDIEVTDTLANANLTLQTGTIQVSLNGTLLAPQPTIVETTPDGFVVSGLTLLPTDEIEIAFDVLLEASAPETESFPNTSTAVFDTVDDGDPDTPTARDESVSDDNRIANAPQLTKTPFTSNFTETSSDTGDDPFQLAIGEDVTFRYTLTLPEIDMDSVVLTDTLPAGLRYESFNVVNFGTPAMTDTSNVALTDPTDSVAGQVVTFDFGDVRNPFDGTIGADDVITFEVTAVVTDVAAATAGATLTNTASLTVTPTGQGPLDPVTDTADVEIVEPLLTIDKTGPLVVEPGGTVSYTTTIENPGPAGGNAGPAYDVVVDITLPPEIPLDTGSVVFRIDGVIVTPTFTANAGGISATIPVLEPGQTLTVDYNGTLSPTAMPPESFEADAVANYDSAPGANPDQRVYAQIEDDHRVALPPTLDKSIDTTSVAATGSGEYDPANDDVNIGELITYEMVLTIPEIPADNLTLTDTLPTGLEFVSADIVSVGSEISGVTPADAPTVISNVGQLVTFDFGAIDNAFSDGVINGNDQIVVSLTARVQDIASVNDGDVLTNDASLVLTPQGEGPLPPVEDDVSVDVVEPEVSITKDVSETEPDAGDVITYTVEVTNDPAATGPALNVVVTDPLPTDLSLTGAVSATGAGASVTSSSGTTLVVSIPVLQPGETVTITYDVFVGYATPPLVDVINTATVTGGTSGDPMDPGRPFTDDDSETIEVQPIDAPVFEPPERLVGGGIDDERFLPILLIDPIYSGTAEYGANVSISLYQWDGRLSYVRNVVADAGGHWIAIFPRVTLIDVDDDFHQRYESSVLFREPVMYLDDRVGFDSSGAPITGRTFFVGTELEDTNYTVQIRQDRPSILPDENGMHNARVYFAPATIGEAYARGDVLKVDEVFENVAELSVKRLYEATVDPLATGLNRFNYEFLSDDTAIPGSAR